MSTSISTGMGDLLCFTTFYFYDLCACVIQHNIIHAKTAKYKSRIKKKEWPLSNHVDDNVIAVIS